MTDSKRFDAIPVHRGERSGAGGGQGGASGPGGFTHVSTAYDRIGADYRESKQLPFRRHVEEHTTFRLLPALGGLRVVDLACGEGIYSRRLARRGAARVVGVDISAEMVAMARAAERADPLGATYVQADVANVELDDRFDVAYCSYLFNYASRAEELRRLVESVARLLVPGGVVVGCNDYPDNPPHCYCHYRPYGFIKLGRSQPSPGDTITYRFFNPDGTVFELDNYYLPSDLYRAEFERAGFVDFSFVMPEVSEEGLAAFPAGFWDAYLGAPPIVSLVARVPG